MSPFQSPDGVLDYTVPALTAIDFGLVVMVVGSIALAFKIRRNRRNEKVRDTRALRVLEPAIEQLYRSAHLLTDPAHYSNWRVDYVVACETKFGRSIWHTCVTSGALPPLDVIFGEPVH